jgi:hypothetical protein
VNVFLGLRVKIDNSDVGLFLVKVEGIIKASKKSKMIFEEK